MDAGDGCASSRPQRGPGGGRPVLGPSLAAVAAGVASLNSTQDPGTTDSETASSSQPATQPCDDLSQSSMPDCDSEDDQQPNLIWGKLLPLQDNWKAAYLTEDVCTFGRSGSNTFPIGEDQAGKRAVALSKIHFAVQRSRDGVMLLDKSSNGTWVNGLKVGRGKSRMLEHNSIISLSHQKLRCYVYLSTSYDYQRDYPAELTSKYIVSRDLGSGACGTVRLGFRVDGQENVERPHRVAIKAINKKTMPLNKGACSNVMNEVKILQAVDHPCVIRLEDVVDTEDVLFIILELADGGELFEKVIEKTRFNEQEARLYFYQMVSAVEYLHSAKIAHRDLKPENVLLLHFDDDSDPLIKITDMGLSKLVDVQSKLKTFCGTPQYLAPEVLYSRVRGDGSYGFEVDMWSLGVILYILLSGCPPFNPDNQEKPLVRQICDGDYSFASPRWSNISSGAKDLISRLMVVDRRKRLSASETLLHPWLTSDPDVINKAQLLMKKQRERQREAESKSRKSLTAQPADSADGCNQQGPHQPLVLDGMVAGDDDRASSNHLNHHCRSQQPATRTRKENATNNCQILPAPNPKRIKLTGAAECELDSARANFVTVLPDGSPTGDDSNSGCETPLYTGEGVDEVVS